MPTISIGLPIYNGEKYICEALDSLLSQTFKDFEILISDNCSTDSTSAIVQGYASKDSRIRYTRQSANQGATLNFQIVMNQATGEYFMWASADDKWSPNWLECLHEKIVSSNVGMAFGSVMHIDKMGDPIKHQANGAHFQYRGGPLLRRLKFYLQNETAGKSNSMFSLFKIEMIPHLNAIWSKLIQGQCVYDFTAAYDCLKYQGLEYAPQTILYKRVHTSGAGTLKKRGALGKLKWLVWPILPGLIQDYLRNSSGFEKIILVVFFPVKLSIAYVFQFRRIVRKLRAIVN